MVGNGKFFLSNGYRGFFWSEMLAGDGLNNGFVPGVMPFDPPQLRWTPQTPGSSDHAPSQAPIDRRECHNKRDFSPKI